MIHTVLVGSDQDRITRRSVTYAGPGQYPNPVLGPLFQFVQHESRVIQFDNFRFRVGASALDDLQLVVRDPPVRSISRWRFPCNQYGRWAARLSAYIARRSPGDCITLSYWGGKTKRKAWLGRRRSWNDRGGLRGSSLEPKVSDNSLEFGVIRRGSVRLDARARVREALVQLKC